MAPRKVAAKDKNVASVITMAPVRLRAQVEKLARQERVSVSEIGRRALTEFVGKQVVEQQVV